MSIPEDVNKGRRVSIDLTPAASREVDRLKSITNLSTAGLFRYSLTLVRDCVDGAQRGMELRLVDPKGRTVAERLRLPMIIEQRSTESQTGEREQQGTA